LPAGEIWGGGFFISSIEDARVKETADGNTIAMLSIDRFRCLERESKVRLKVRRELEKEAVSL
jgi:hypothetical protein